MIIKTKWIKNKLPKIFLKFRFMASLIGKSKSDKSMQTHEIRCKSDKDFFKKFRSKSEDSITTDEQVLKKKNFKNNKFDLI